MARPDIRLPLALVLLCIALPAMGVPSAEEHLVDAGDYRLFLKVIRGDGPVILLESGGGGDSSEWDDLAPSLYEATGATVVAYDRPGFGRSDLPDLPCDMREESQSLWRALAELEMDRDVILVGLSYGGWMIRLHAHDHPDRVRGLVFLDPFNCEFVDALGLEYCNNHPMMGNLPFKDDDPATLSPQQKALLRMMGEGLGPKVALMRETMVPEGIPVHWIRSARRFLPLEHEQTAWWAAQEKTARAIPGVVLTVAEQSGHMVSFDQPELVVEAVRAVMGM